MKIEKAKFEQAIGILLNLYDGIDDDGMEKFLTELEAIGIPPEDPRPQIIQASVELLMDCSDPDEIPAYVEDALKALGDEFE